MEVTPNSIKRTKRHFSASGSILLPLALKWRLATLMICGTFVALVLPGIIVGNVSATSITLEIPADLSLTVKPDGQFHSQQSATPVKITSDALAGYAFTMSGANNSNALKNTQDSSRTIPSITAETEEAAFEGNHWGFKLAKKGAVLNTKYRPGPTKDTPIDTTTEPNAEANEYTITLGAKVDANIAAGTYHNTFTLTVTANPIPYTIIYNQNTEDKVTEMPSQETSQSPDGQVAVSDKEPLRDNYEFIGWCDTTPTQEDKVDICRDGNAYQAKDNLTLKSNTNNITLYAMWVNNSQIMQNWKGCSSLEKTSSIHL